MGEGAAPAPAPGQFERDTSVRILERDGSHSSFAAEVSDGWRAGRGPHGGYLAAMILRAFMSALDDARRSPRSLTIHFLRAPEPGPVQIDAVIERGGRSLSSLSAKMTQHGQAMALALAAFSVPWRGPELSEQLMPEVAAPAPERQPGALIAPERGGPPFGRHITFQPRLGGMPFAGHEHAMETGGWIGLVEPRPLDALALAFYTDALIPTPFMRLAAFTPAPTVDITIHFRTALAAYERDELVFARARARMVHEGFFVEDAEIWAADGTLLAQSRQLALLVS